MAELFNENWQEEVAQFRRYSGIFDKRCQKSIIGYTLLLIFSLSYRRRSSNIVIFKVVVRFMFVVSYYRNHYVTMVDMPVVSTSVSTSSKY